MLGQDVLTQGDALRYLECYCGRLQLYCHNKLIKHNMARRSTLKLSYARQYFSIIKFIWLTVL